MDIKKTNAITGGKKTTKPKSKTSKPKSKTTKPKSKTSKPKSKTTKPKAKTTKPKAKTMSDYKKEDLVKIAKRKDVCLTGRDKKPKSKEQLYRSLKYHKCI